MKEMIGLELGLVCEEVDQIKLLELSLKTRLRAVYYLNKLNSNKI